MQQIIAHIVLSAQLTLVAESNMRGKSIPHVINEVSNGQVGTL